MFRDMLLQKILKKGNEIKFDPVCVHTVRCEPTEKHYGVDIRTGGGGGGGGGG